MVQHDPPVKKQWKAVLLDYDALKDYDTEDIVGVCLTQQQVAILKALLTTAYWTTRWTNLSISKNELDYMIAALDSQLDGNDCNIVRLDMLGYRDNPFDPCEVQFTIDGGETWTTMFRKDVCPPGYSIDIDNIANTKTTITTNNTTYAGDILNVAPAWNYIGGDTDKALCLAISIYVDMVCDVSIANIKSENVDRRNTLDFLDSMTDVLNAALVAVATFINLPAVITACVVWVATEAMEEWLDWLIGKDYSIFEDEDARQVVACYMYQEIKGATPQFAPWEASLEAFSHAGVAENAIGGAVNIANHDVNAYINWLMLLEDLNTVAASLPVCDCPDRWSHHWNFATHGKDVWELIAPNYGTWVADTGFVGTEEFISGAWHNIIQWLKFPEAVPNCDTVRVHLNITRGHFAANVDAITIWPQPVAAGVWKQGHIVTDPDQHFDYVFALDQLVQVSLSWLVCYTGGADRGYLEIKGVTLMGEGVDPFSGRDTG